jgi:hypothetical protein
MGFYRLGLEVDMYFKADIQTVEVEFGYAAMFSEEAIEAAEHQYPGCRVVRVERDPA